MRQRQPFNPVGPDDEFVQGDVLRIVACLAPDETPPDADSTTTLINTSTGENSHLVCTSSKTVSHPDCENGAWEVIIKVEQLPDPTRMGAVESIIEGFAVVPNDQGSIVEMGIESSGMAKFVWIGLALLAVWFILRN